MSVTSQTDNYLKLNGAGNQLLNSELLSSVTSLSAKSAGASTAMSFLAPENAIPAAQLTPTVTEFLNGAMSEYVIGGVPAGMKPLLQNGKQMSFHDDLTGGVGHAWITPENQVLITYSGTTRGENLLIDPLATAGGLLSDLGILLRQVSPAQKEALAFAKQVVAAAGQQGYSSDQIFVTGHSLGGIEAEYVSQQTGLAGIGFEASGIPKDPNAIGKGSNFISVVTQGDPVANYSSDVAGEQPFAPAYVPQSQGGGAYPHYGSVLQIGAASDQTALSLAAHAVVNPFTTALGLAGAVALIAEFHFPKAEYAALGVTPTGSALDKLPSTIGVAHGPVLPVANDTIGQLQAYMSNHVTIGA
ncbi:lipase [Acetobacter sacchari]|uniref:Lipase n=1 Tax=Acetobacter sacchari TaxID=2661687 RepID=A0ABS3LVS4_9PROT|nr:lipase [Acetobacter sacchari]MBO1360017.1 lipase [Acetobacter sacchari]